MWVHNDMYICLIIYSHTHIRPYALYIYVCVLTRVSVGVGILYSLNFPPSQLMLTLIPLDLVGLDQKLLMKWKAQTAWRL